MKILGVHYGHDSAAALIVDGRVVAAAAEERFTRIKNDSTFPLHAIRFCLEQGGLESTDIDCLAVPSNKMGFAYLSFFDIPSQQGFWKGKKREFKSAIKRKIARLTVDPLGGLPLYQKKFLLSAKCTVHLCEHHLAHAASAYFTSGPHKRDALIVTMDGMGDEISSAVWRGRGNTIEPVEKYGPDSSIGWFYGNATEALGWRHGSDEWKVMGLAPYGTPQPGVLRGFYPEFKDGFLVQPHNFGTFSFWNDHGSYHYHGTESADLVPWVEKLGRENFAAEVQRVVEEQSMELILPWLDRLGTRDLCGAGGCFLNVKLNQKLWYSGRLDKLWIYPDPADAGLAVGAALHAYFTSHPEAEIPLLDNVYWGPEYDDAAIETILRERGLNYERVEDPAEAAAQYLVHNLALGWFQGRMETGPRALGGRSILMSPLKAENKDLINAKVKYREAFRPFCPSILYERAGDYLIKPRDELFMISSFEARPEKHAAVSAVVHVDGTLRPQLVKKEVNPLYHRLIRRFGELSGEYAVLNTSFNVKGEPIVCTPRQAVKCFFDTGLDVLIMGHYVVKKPALKQVVSGQ